MTKKTKKKIRRALRRGTAILGALLVLGIGGLLLRRGLSPKETESEPTPTPAEVTVAPTASPEPTISPYAGLDVRISEVCCANLAMVQDENGAFPDWVELWNAGDTVVELRNWRLSDGEKKEGWAFEEGSVLQAGERLLLYCDGENRGSHTDFSLRVGESVYLRDPGGEVRSVLCTEGCGKGESATLNEDGSVSFSRFVTPGFENSEAGYLAYQESLVCTSPLRISECVNSNASSFYHWAGGGYNDWLEIHNAGSEAVSTEGYYLSDSAGNPKLWAIPARTLYPGDHWAFQCSGDETLSEGYITHTNFKIDGTAEGLYLFDAEGRVVDFLYVHDVPCEGSIGRADGQNGVFFMDVTTPNARNREGFRLYAENPVCLTPDGVYKGVESVTVELSADKPIYYTTDGSIPGPDSLRYEGPLTLTETTVIRAACCEPDKLTQRPLSLSYMINEETELPVASIVTERSNLFGSGIYDCWFNFDGRQVPASLSLYEGEQSFTVDCGLKMFGHTGLKNDKKSMKVLFRSRFGSESFHYDIFGDGSEDFTSLCLRAGQDCNFSVIRDELFQSLSADFSDKVLVQRYKYCALYINGSYWGLYALKDAYSEDYYAEKRGVSGESVTKLQAPVGPDAADFYQKVLRYAQEHDMSDSANYAEFCEQVDIDSLIDWAIVEGYSANADVQQNLRYFRSTENGKRWEFAFYDLDWAFYYENNLTCVFWGIGEDGSVLQHCLYIHPLLDNAEFRDRFCKRLAEALGGVFSEENVIARIDELSAEIASEIPRDRARWGIGGSWESRVEELRAFVRNGWTKKMIDGACEYCNLTPEEREAYFGEIEG